MEAHDILTLRAKKEAIRTYGPLVVNKMLQNAKYSILARQKALFRLQKSFCCYHEIATSRARYLNELVGVSVVDITIEVYMYRLAATEMTIYN